MKKEITMRQITDTSNVCWDISAEQANALGYRMCEAAREFLSKPENMAAFEAWREKRRAEREAAERQA